MRLLAERSERELAEAVPDEEVRRAATSTVDLDSDAATCPACLGALPRGATRCPGCLLRLG